MSGSIISARLSKSRGIVAGALVLVALELGIGILAGRSRGASKAAAAPAVDPRLVLHPHAVVSQGRFWNGVPC